MNNLKNKLLHDFNVKIISHSIKLNQAPIMILEFPIEVTQKLNSLLSKPGQNLSFFTTKAFLYARGNGYIPTNAAELKALILSQNPYQIQIQGIYPLVYFFVNCILTEKQTML